MTRSTHPEDPMPILKRTPLTRKKGTLNEVLESTTEYYASIVDRYVSFYDEYLPLRASAEYRQGYERVAELLRQQVEPQQLVLEIGCGIGYWTVLMAEQGAKVKAIDSVSAMLSKCRDRLEQKGLADRVDLHPNDAFELPFKNERFDGVVLTWVLSHLPPGKGRELVGRLGRIMRKGGWLFVSDSYWRGQEGGKEQEQVREIPGGVCRVYKYYYDADELKNLLEECFGPVTLSETTAYELILLALKTDSE